ncbi:MAG: homoserine dehydrogenase [Verrucomicrobia bacterium]|nr:MAG: homoserine dehydrogenase [Verrucomicrobiota bacterium]
MESIGIGLAGFGTVGAGVFQALQRNAELLYRRLGVRFEVRRIAMRHPAKKRAIAAPEKLITTDWSDLVNDPSIRIIVELMGGTEEPLNLFRSAIAAKKILITANKALLANHGIEIFQLAEAANVPIFYEAAVAGGIPIIKSLREAFVGNHFESIHGILNGTSNYILTRMTESNMDFHQALGEAQSHGFAEADPTLDVNGWDAAHKAIILASLAYGFWLNSVDIQVGGIENISPLDIQFARELGYTIKLLASIRSHLDEKIEVSVHPALIPQAHVLASVNGVFNAILIRGDIVGESLFYGRGAGQDPTASSVLGDLAEAAQAVAFPRASCGFKPHNLRGQVKEAHSCVSSFYLRLDVDDRPGVLAQIANILGRAQIGISSVIQPEGKDTHQTHLVLMLHNAPTGAASEAVSQIATLSCVKGKPVLLHVEHFA